MDLMVLGEGEGARGTQPSLEPSASLPGSAGLFGPPDPPGPLGPQSGASALTLLSSGMFLL